MWNYPDEEDLIRRFSKHATTAGIIFIALGLLGMLFPAFLSLATVYLIGWLFVFAGVLIGYFTYITDRSEWLGWLKTFILVLTGLLLVIHPLPGIAAIGLLLAIYLFMDAFGSGAIAFSMKPAKGWWLWLVNGAFSLILAIIFIVGWPFSSVWLVGLFIGISLFFDGILLFSMGRFMKDIDDNLEDRE